MNELYLDREPVYSVIVGVYHHNRGEQGSVDLFEHNFCEDQEIGHDPR